MTAADKLDPARDHVDYALGIRRVRLTGDGLGGKGVI